MTDTAAASGANRGRLSLAWAARMQQTGKQNGVPYLDGLTELLDEERRARTTPARQRRRKNNGLERFRKKTRADSPLLLGE